jgi:PIN domain nuclease of toxin-antitoxin system
MKILLDTRIFLWAVSAPTSPLPDRQALILNAD